MSIDSLFAEQYHVTARNPFYSGIRIIDEYDFFPKGIPSLDTAYAGLVDSSHALNQILESPSFEEVDDFYNPGTDEVSPDYVLEAITVESFSRTEKRIAAVVRVFNKHLANSAVSALPPVVGTPKKSGSFAYVTVQLPFTDGQTVSVIFHAPEGDKKKITASDPIIAFRWLLNKRDITQIVAPEEGVEVSLDTIALRVTQLVLKNSARFEKQQKGAAEERKALEDAKAAVQGEEEKQAALMDSIAKSKEDEQDLDARIQAIKTSIERQRTKNAELRAKLDALRAQRKQEESTHSLSSKNGEIEAEEDVSPEEKVAVHFGRLWEKGGHRRVYFDAKEVAEAVGFELRRVRGTKRYFLGNDEYTNSSMEKLFKAFDKTYYDLTEKTFVSTTSKNELLDSFKTVFYGKVESVKMAQRQAKPSSTEKSAPAARNEETKAVKREDADALTICADGYEHGDFTHNPYLLTSDNSDAFVFGVWAKQQGKVMPQKLKKSRGNSWKVDDSVYKIDENDVTLVSGPGLSPTSNVTNEGSTTQDIPQYIKMLNDILSGKYDSNIDTLDNILDMAAEQAESEGTMEEYDSLFNQAADYLTNLLEKEVA